MVKALLCLGLARGDAMRHDVAIGQLTYPTCAFPHFESYAYRYE